LHCAHPIEVVSLHLLRRLLDALGRQQLLADRIEQNRFDSITARNAPGDGTISQALGDVVSRFGAMLSSPRLSNAYAFYATPRISETRLRYSLMSTQLPQRHHAREHNAAL
jgi:hypothetical protein